MVSLLLLRPVFLPALFSLPIFPLSMEILTLQIHSLSSVPLGSREGKLEGRRTQRQLSDRLLTLLAHCSLLSFGEIY